MYVMRMGSEFRTGTPIIKCGTTILGGKVNAQRVVFELTRGYSFGEYLHYDVTIDLRHVWCVGAEGHLR